MAEKSNRCTKQMLNKPSMGSDYSTEYLRARQFSCFINLKEQPEK